MDKKEVAGTIGKVMARVLEDASFVFTDDLSSPAPAIGAPDGIVGVSLGFNGAGTGVFRLWAAPRFTALLAANMTGVDVDSPEALEKGSDAMKEILNIIVGNALTELFGTSAVFELGIPAAADPALYEPDRLRVDAVWLLAEELPVLCVADLRNV